MNKPYDRCDMDDDLSMIFITIGDYVIIALLAPQNGLYIADIHPNGAGARLASFSDTSPALAIGKCKQWIADNQIIENEVMSNE